MNLKELKEQISTTIQNLKDHGKFPKENNLYDYKMELNFYGLTECVEVFMRNFAKDILSFANSNGGIILLGIKEDKRTGTLEDIGLDVNNIELLNQIDLSLVSQKFNKVAKVGVDLDLQSFQIGTRNFFYLLIEKQNQIIIPINDYKDYNIKKGEIIYRVSGNNEIANSTTQDFNKFIQIKANEKNKEFMEIWSKLLPEMFDINPREVLILNPKNNTVYGYNSKENLLSSSEIEIDQTENGIFNIILNAISAGDIGKISNDEGKPIYKIVGELRSKTPRDFIYFSSLLDKIKAKSNYNISSIQLKCVFKYFNWIADEKLPIENPDETQINNEFNQLIWVEVLDKTHKIVFSKNAINPIIEAINDNKKHNSIFGKSLGIKTVKSKSKTK
ncbi:ATP-binding protein [Arundinibacter roseus]|uniref:ATP-binding protein n=1 Tax=Arundinibacter roseus TaxID=2070510 RepID=A0A4R4K784_9BACT|nr:ATP-binding protein [Arundinibacter roseus]TDB63310.1 ATP-binding protein [Arundinibacter roseus]